MEFIKLACNKFIETKPQITFNKSHKRALLCFAKYKKLDLYQLVMLMDTDKKSVLKVLDELMALKLVNFSKPHYEVENIFDALNRLVDLAEPTL